ncbi:tetratricopeptide repeat protein [Flavobacterium sp.]|uniref:tetratricopeptide repeat protein n=1 Tax=Flavobacterium sp. TaxID=239 RepID=UPI0026088568|nr:tetratricopeptide repeat protein [Flavobacterium sp.]
MNVTEYTHLINKPEAVHEKQTEALEKIVQEFPYFQSARALYLKGLYNQNSFKYNYALKIAAAHTTDRSILFDFITSDNFTSVQKELYDQKTAEILDIQVEDGEVLSKIPQEILSENTEDEAVSAEGVKLEIRENTVEQSLLSSIKESEPPTVELEVPKLTIDDFVEIPNEVETETTIEETIVEENLVEETPTVEDKLDLGKPLAFSLTERHSFQEWLQLSKLKPIERETPQEQPVISEPEPTSEVNFEKQKKNVLIDKFIEANPKIPPVKKDSEIPAIFYEPSNADNSSLMTETLARVYLEQKKYQKAIQAYEILILKYPEKSSFFADRILDIKHLQQNNKQQ